MSMVATENFFDFIPKYKDRAIPPAKRRPLGLINLHYSYKLY